MTDQNVTTPRTDVVHQPTDTHPLVKSAMESGPLDPATLRELMTMQREWEAGEARKEYTRDMVAMKREFPTVLARDKTVTFVTKGGTPTTYTHTSLAAAVEAITPSLCSYDFSVSWTTRIGERNMIEVTCTATHRAGHSESCTLAAPPETSGTKNPVQAVASTVTLLERYTMLALLGIATKDQVDPQPTGAAERAQKIDAAKNLKWAGYLKNNGHSVADWEQRFGRRVPEWTLDDCAELSREFSKKPGEQESARQAEESPEVDGDPSATEDDRWSDPDH